MGALSDAIREFEDRRKTFSWRNSESWRAVEEKFQALSDLFGAGASREDFDKAREAFSKACIAYGNAHRDSGDPKRYQAVRGLWQQVNALTERDIQIGADSRVSLREYAENGEPYRAAYQTKIIGYRSASEDQMKAALTGKKSLLPGVDLSAVTEYQMDYSIPINEANAKAEVKKLDDYRKACRQIMEEGKRTRNLELETYGSRLLRQVQDSPLDNLRDLRLVRELEREGKTFADRDSYKTPEVNEAIDRSNTAGAHSSIRYSNMTVGDTKGFLTPFAEMYFDNQSNRIGEIIHREKLSREAIRVLNWVRDSGRIGIRSTTFNGSLYERIASRDGKKEFGEELINQVVEELAEKDVFSRWDKDLDKDQTYMQFMGDGGPVYESGFMEKRNVAMSRVAELLGMGDVVARSRVVTFEEDGKKHKACFMDTAKGIQIYDGQKDIVKTKDVEVRPEAWKKAERLMILDTICGQVDRHIGNFFVQIEKGPDGKLVIVDLSGIDNDLAFANKPYDEDQAERGILLDNFRGSSRVPGAGDGNSLFIDETVAEKIRNLTEEDLRYAVGDCLPEKDIQALWDRTKKVKDLLDPEKSKENHIVVLRDDEADWEFKKDANGQLVHRLAAPDAPDREAFMKNADLFMKCTAEGRGPSLMRMEKAVKDVQEKAQRMEADAKAREEAEAKAKEEAAKKETIKKEAETPGRNRSQTVFVKPQEMELQEQKPDRERVSYDKLAAEEKAKDQKPVRERPKWREAAKNRQAEKEPMTGVLGGHRSR